MDLRGSTVSTKEYTVSIGDFWNPMSAQIISIKLKFLSQKNRCFLVYRFNQFYHSETQPVFGVCILMERKNCKIEIRCKNCRNWC